MTPEQLFELHRPMVEKMAERHASNMTAAHWDLDDLTQAALIGAWEAIQTFDGRSPMKARIRFLATKAMEDFVRDHGFGPLRVSRHGQRQLKAVRQGDTSVSREKQAELREATSRPIPLYVDGDRGTEALPVPDRGATAEQTVTQVETRAQVENALAGLPDDERRALALHLGLSEEGAPLRLVEVADLLDVSVKAAEILVGRALAMLKHPAMAPHRAAIMAAVLDAA